MARGIRTWINYLSKKNIKRVYIYRYNFSTFNKRELDEYWSLNNKDNNFGSYLAGLFEGDGHIWIPKENMIKKHNPRFCITFHIKDLPLAKIILKKIGFGFIRIKSKENAVVLTVSPIKGLKYILSQISNYLRTPKINQVNKLIDWLNKYQDTNYPSIVCNENTLESDNWLAGFIDADGGFYIYYFHKTEINKCIIKLTFTIEQRIIDPVSKESYELIMKKIANFFKINLSIRSQKSTGNSYFRLVVTNKLSKSILINYLINYSLYSSKFLNYIDWKEVHKLKMNNRNLSIEDKSKILLLKSNMNNKRTQFNWDHVYKSNIFI